MRKRISFIEIAMILVMILLLLFFGLIFKKGNVLASIGICLSNLRQIGLACGEYTQDYNGNFPERLLDLYPKYLSDYTKECLACPGAHMEFMTPPPGEYAYKLPANFSEKDIDYLYTKGLTENSPGKSILVQDKPGNHPQGIINVVYIDGQVETINTRPWYKRNF